jgi:hypothetical protein
MADARTEIFEGGCGFFSLGPHHKHGDEALRDSRDGRPKERAAACLVVIAKAIESHARPDSICWRRRNTQADGDELPSANAGRMWQQPLFEVVFLRVSISIQN